MPNKLTIEIKEFFRDLVNDPDVQEAFKDGILERDKGFQAAFLGAASHVLGKPRETVQLDTTPGMAKLITMALQVSREGVGKDKGKG